MFFYTDICLSYVVSRYICLFILMHFCAYTVHAQSYVFVGSYNWDKNKDGLYVYKLDTISGDLSFVTSYKILNPSYLILSANGKYIYACTETKTQGAGSVSSFSFEHRNGELHYLNTQSSEGENPVYVTTDRAGKWLVDANYTEAGVSVYALNADGSIANIAQHIDFKGKSLNEERQEAAHIHAAVFSPFEDNIYLPDLGSDKIWCYQFDGSLAQPLPGPLSFITTTPGSGPRHLCFHPNGLFFYCIEELTGTISTYKYRKGFASPLQHINAHTDKYISGFNSADIHISPDGKFLYASNRGDENNIAIYSINEDGTLASIGYQSTFGNHPRIFDIDPTGKFLVVANQISGDVVVFRRDKKTGLLQQAGKPTKVLNASCVKIFKY
jgi:6-phosphogluconolactonase